MVKTMKPPPVDLAERLVNLSEELLRPEDPLRFEDIAARVGASRATLYYYFAGRDDLLAFLLVAHVEEGAAAMAAADPGSEPAQRRLRAVVGAAITYLGRRPRVCAGLLAAAGSAGRMSDVLEANDAHIAAPLRELIASGVAAGELAVQDPADATNAVLGAVLMGVLGHMAADRDATDGAFRDGLVDQITRGLTAG